MPAAAPLDSALLERLARRTAADSELAVHARFLDLRLGVGVGDSEFLLFFEGGELVEFGPRPPGATAELRIAGSDEDWAGFLSVRPAPGYADLIGLERQSPSFSIEGDPALFARHLRALSRVFRLAQLEADGPGDG